MFTKRERFFGWQFPKEPKILYSPITILNSNLKGPCQAIFRDSVAHKLVLK